MNVVMVRPSQSQMLKVRKQQTEMKKRSEGTKSTVTPPPHITPEHRLPVQTHRVGVKPSLPHFVEKIVFTSAVTAGKTDRVTVKTNVTQNAMTQI